MKIAIPLVNEQTLLHAGHATRFALFDIDRMGQTTFQREDIDAPPHQPGRLPHWLAEHSVTVIIATGLGQNSVRLCTELGIQVVLGAAMDSPENLVDAYIKNKPRQGAPS